MMMTKKNLIFLIILLFLSSLLTAQQGGRAIIEYIEGDPFEVTITLPSGEIIEAFIGQEMELESTIQTGDANVEIRLDPNGTILNLGSNTIFAINSIQGRNESRETSMNLLKGRLRTVAARLGRENQYNISTPTSVCGIRGTEIFNSVTDSENFIMCKSGLVEVISNADPSNRVEIGANQVVDTLAAGFSPLAVTPQDVDALFNSLPFRKLDPGAVPGQNLKTEPGTEEEPSESAVEKQEQSVETQDFAPLPPESEPSTEKKGMEETAEPREPTWLELWFSDHMNFQVGSVTVNGETWAKAIMQPVFQAGDFRLGLYLPVIYRENLLDSDDWYHPEGNNEWSFGSDQEGWQDILWDFNSDLWLKVRYLEYGNPLWDPFYLKVGNLESMTLGHGSLVKNYNNNINFPSERKVGLNLGATLGSFKLETLLDDTADPSLIGGRIQIRSGKPFALGLSSIVDLYPASDAEDPESLGDPMLLGGSIDLELFSFNTALLKMMAFADTSTVLPLYRNQPTGTTFNTSDPSALIWDEETPRNFGMKTGVRGKVTFIDFSVDIRYEDGIFRHNMFDNLYQRNRLSYITTINSFLENPEETESTLGLYGEGGFSLFQEKVRLSAAYLWPWEIERSDIRIGDDDYFLMGLELCKGMIPFYDLSGAVYYERKNLASSIRDDSFVLLDENSVLTGEVVLPLAPVLDLALIVSSSTLYDEGGNLVMESDGITPKIVPVFNIETRIHF